MKAVNKTKLALLLVGFLIIIITISYIIDYKSNVQETSQLLNGECYSQLIKVDKAAGFLAKISIYINLNRDGLGYVDMSGKLDYVNNKGMIIARSYKFNYKLFEKDIFHLNQIQLTKRSADNADDNLMSEMIMSVNTTPSLYVRITKLLNSYVIGNVYSPLLICVIKNNNGKTHS